MVDLFTGLSYLFGILSNSFMLGYFIRMYNGVPVFLDVYYCTSIFISIPGASISRYNVK